MDGVGQAKKWGIAKSVTQQRKAIKHNGNKGVGRDEDGVKSAADLMKKVYGNRNRNSSKRINKEHVTDTTSSADVPDTYFTLFAGSAGRRKRSYLPLLKER